jgi:nucleoside-diphosphate-sugar epimerase
MLRNITVIGTGLIGASAALAARRAGAYVRGWDPDPDVLRAAQAREAVDPMETFANAVAGADLVLIAAPVAELPHVVRDVLAVAPDGCAVTDVGSTKSAVCAAADGDERFIGAGQESVEYRLKCARNASRLGPREGGKCRQCNENNGEATHGNQCQCKRGAALWLTFNRESSDSGTRSRS